MIEELNLDSHLNPRRPRKVNIVPERDLEDKSVTYSKVQLKGKLTADDFHSSDADATDTTKGISSFDEDSYSLTSGEAEIGKLKEGEDLAFLAGTSEVPMVAYHHNETFREEELPIKYVAFSPCFRREIGSYGQDTPA